MYNVDAKIIGEIHNSDKNKKQVTLSHGNNNSTCTESEITNFCTNQS